jgi:hypothetical protein
MAEFYQKYRLIPASINADVALILSHIAYWSGCNEAARVTVAPSRGHSYQVKHPWDNDRIVRIKDYYDHREGVVGWNTP